MDFDDDDFNVLTNDNEEPAASSFVDLQVENNHNQDENCFQNIKIRQEKDLIDRRVRNFDNFDVGSSAQPGSVRKRKSPIDIFDSCELDPEGKHPIDWHENWDHGMSKEEALKAKRAKLEAEYLDKLMVRIELAKARKFGEQNSSDNLSFDHEHESGPTNKAAKIYNLIPQNAGNWMRISSPDVDAHFYIVAHLRNSDHKKNEFSSFSNKPSSGVLGKRFQEVLDEANRIRRMKAESAVVGSPLEEMEDTLPPSPISQLTDRAVKESHKDRGDLWVEKYKPRMYTDLLSDDGINRTLLTWLKLWDECVFNRKQPSNRKKTNKDLSEQTKLATKFQDRRDAKLRKKFAKRVDADELSTELDEHKRPQHKIALLCGAPGMGKTTLANIIARVAGYHVVELNASDDRTLDHFKSALEGATQMKSTLDADPRPNCLIIDEIDGAPTVSINYLLNLAKSEEKGKRRKILKRPVICICNDLYVPALRELRKVALVLPFPQTSIFRLTERLHYVCRQEDLATDQKTLEALCDKTCQDIRACLNTIQFASSKTGTTRCPTTAQTERKLSLLDVESSALGQKDSQKTLFTVWHQIFEMPRMKGKFHLGQLVSDENSNKDGRNPRHPSVRFETIYRLVVGTGEGEKLRQGIYDNFLNVKMTESEGMDLVDVGLEWFCFVDLLGSQVNRSQVFELLRYGNFLPVIVHLMFATNSYPTIQFPHSQYEALQKRQKSANILSSVLDGACPLVFQHSDRECLASEILPYVSDIIQPTLRPVNMQLYSAKERAELMQIIQTMIQYSLTYRQQRSNEGTYEFVLEPAVDNFSEYPDVKPGKRLSYSAKQMLAREVDLERMRKSERFSGKGNRTAEPMDVDTKENRKKAPTTKNHLQYLQPKAVAPIEEGAKEQESKVPRMFFAPKGVVSKNKSKEEEEHLRVPRSTGIWFKYKEGYSNAIRRNIKMKDLL